MTNEQQEFERFIRTKLDESVDALDGATRAHLIAMRREALAQGGKSRGWQLPASLAAAMAAFMLIWMLPQQQADHGVDAAMEDMDVLASDVDVELLENVEFYQWLEGSPDFS
jgi:hypothetical protein